MKLTPWFPASVKPVRDGVYQVHTPNCLANKFAYFDKLGWRLCADCERDAKKEKFRTNDMHCSSMNLKNSKWRGIAK